MWFPEKKERKCSHQILKYAEKRIVPDTNTHAHNVQFYCVSI